MKRNRDGLVSEINLAIEEITKRGIFEEMLKAAKDKNGLKRYFTDSKIKKILQKSVVYSTMSDCDLYNISLFLNDNKLMNVDLTEYFDKDEINEAINNILEEEEYGDIITFKRVLADDDEQEFITMLDYKDLAKMFRASLFNYNFVTQRKAKTVKLKGVETQQADVNMKSVREIADLVKRGKFGMNAITLNMRLTGDEYYDYDPHNMILSINTNLTEIDEIDGYHRTEGITLAYEEKPNITGKITVIIKHLTVDAARAFIAQEAMGNVNNQEDMKLYNPLGAVARFVKYVNESYNGNGILSNRISVSGSAETYIFDGVFSKNVDKACSKKILDDADDVEIREFADYVCDFYSATYSYINRKFKVKDMDELKGTITRDMMFMSGLLYPATKMYVKNDKKIDNKMISGMVDKLDLKSDIDSNNYTYEEDDKKSFNRYVKAWETVL